MTAAPAKAASLRDSMPSTAAWIDARRAEFGAAYVNDCIRRAITKADGSAGEPGLFYAVENGRVLGTPFPATSPAAWLQTLAVVVGAKFAAFIKPPAGDPQ